MRPNSAQPISDIPLKIVGGDSYGRTPKINAERTYNMFVSDGFLVDTPGYKKAIDYPGRTVGRAIYSSDRGGFMLCVVDNVVFKISGPKNFLTSQELFRLDTFAGDVFIDENLAGQIALCDQQDLWIYNFITNAPAVKATLPLTLTRPGYVTYHDGYFIVPDAAGTQWFLSAPNNGLSWNWGAGGQPVAGALQTKPDSPVAVLRAPGKGNLIYVFGRNVLEMWYNNGSQLFPYQRQNSISVDYGCLSPTTIATMDNFVAWLGVNEKSGPVIMMSEGSNFTRLSTDGIDYRLADIQFPQQSYAFFFKQDGHVFYQITFFNPVDNISLLYDFNTQMFFSVTDEQMNHHVAEAVAFYNNTYYFVSIDDGSVFELNSNFTTYDYNIPGQSDNNQIKEIPRVKICNNVRQIDSSPVIANSLTFTIEQGTDDLYKGTKKRYITSEGGKVISSETRPGYVGILTSSEAINDRYVPRVDMSISKDGGQTFGSFVSKDLNPLGKRKNRVIFWRMGRVNDMVVQLRFWSKSRIAVTDGVIETRTMEGQ